MLWGFRCLFSYGYWVCGGYRFFAFVFLCGFLCCLGRRGFGDWVYWCLFWFLVEAGRLCCGVVWIMLGVLHRRVVW